MEAYPITYQISPPVDQQELRSLFNAAWPEPAATNFEALLSRSLAYICAYAGEHLVGFVNLAWDGGVHAFLLDTTTHPDWQRRGIGRGLVLRAVQVARERGMHWLHVDYEPHLDSFYRSCGFEPTLAGILRLGP